MTDMLFEILSVIVSLPAAVWTTMKIVDRMRSR